MDTTTEATGTGLAESCADVAHGLSNGDWVDAGLGGTDAGLEVLSLVVDPVGTLTSYGVTWPIDLVRPLQDALDAFAGNPPVIRAFAETWAGVAAEVDRVAGELVTEAAAGTTGWRGEAGDAYRGQASGAADAVAGLGALASGISAGAMIMGEAVAFVRQRIQILVGDLVGRLISWTMAAAGTPGLATPAVLARATAAISETVGAVADLVRKLVRTIGNVAPRIRRVLDKLDEIIAKLTRDAEGTTTPSGAVPAPPPAAPATAPAGTPDGPVGSDPPDVPAAADPANGGTAVPPAGRTSRPDNPRTTCFPVSGRRCRNDPVDVSSGEMVLHQVDVELDGRMPLVLTRTHVSTYRAGRSFGRSWSTTLDQRLEFDADGVVLVAEEGMILVYPRPDGDDPVLPEEGPRWPLSVTGDGHQVITDGGRILHFAGSAADTVPLAAIGDRNGNRIDVLRDADGRPTEVRHSGGYRIGIDSADGLITGLRLISQDGSGDVRLLRYGYDEDGRLTEVTNSSAAALRFGYDTAGRIVRWEDRNGQWYGYTYNRRGQCIRTDGSGGFLAGGFDYRDRFTIVTDSYGHQTRYHFNEARQVVREVDPLGHAAVSEWDRHDRLLSRTDPLGRTIRYDYDDNGETTAVVHPDGSRTTVTFNPLRLPLTVIDPDGAVWRREYDERGNLLSETDPAGATTRYSYTSNGRLTSIADPLGHARRVTTNAAGLPVAVTDPLGATRRYVRDVFGRVAQVIDPEGGVTRLRWTVEGRLIARTLPDGATEHWRYDGEGNPIEHTDPSGAVTRTEYTGFDLPAARIGPDGARHEFGYDTELRLVSVTDPQGLVWSYGYDAAGRLVSETDFNGRRTAYGYDRANQLIHRTNGAGETVRYTRNTMGRITEKRAAGVLTTFGYDTIGRLVHASNPDAEVIFQRDPMGRVLVESVNGRAVSSVYDVAGRRLRLTTPSGADARWEYDPNDRPVALHTGGHTMRFGYDRAGREILRGLGAGAVLAQTWDPNGRLAAQAVTAPDLYAPQDARRARQVRRRDYRYRANGQLVGVHDEAGGTRRFELDPAGRLLAVLGDDWTERYGYDPSGNISAATWPLPPDASGGDDQGRREYTGTLISRAGNMHYRHDAQGRMILRQRRTLSGKTLSWRFTWDAEDRLVGVVTPTGTRWRYLYDPLGRRIAKQRLGDTGVAEQIDFSWDGLVLAEQIHSRGHAITWNWAAGEFRPLTQTERIRVREAPQEWIDQQFYALITDLVGAPTELIDPNGRLAWQRLSTAWGLLITTPAPAGPDCPLRFPGQYHDQETGHHYNYFRHYDPASARYASADPLGLAPAPNPHTYVHNPTTWADPLGLTPCPHYTPPGTAYVYRHGHAANPPRLPGHPAPERTEYQADPTRPPAPAPTLARAPAGWDPRGDPVAGGQVLITEPTPPLWSHYPPGEVVTTYPHEHGTTAG
ncbi:MAG TPA: RHS repeat-associated core domain-containing protein [Actinophytocola sp.]|uniref:RHS repeat-associated core domain-containing protein n=1 Tax=Actinophytocola sp. TaxID=1872138 RepID=UPI002DB68AEC|nr:RHS repeat-associated core domain-containing protein [Actinophytocola sp.]HEU5472183.1 RHS repeat-associated core domain-containing protein [Actinophytocola sp.]